MTISNLPLTFSADFNLTTLLEDIAILTGGEVITSDLGLDLKETTVEQLERAKENLAKAGRGDDVDNKVDTILEIAKLAGVGRTTVARYRKVINKGSDKLINKMLRGDVSITSAYMQTQNNRKKKSINPDGVETAMQEEIRAEVELESLGTETVTVKYVQDIHEGRHLLVNNEIECFIMTKDDSKVRDTMSQHPSLKYAVFIIEH